MTSLPPATRIALASGNAGKAREWQALLASSTLEPLDMRAAPPELGETFWQNALAKARYGATLAPADHWVLGEDSGLLVDALDGAPGVHSARYAGDTATDEANVSVLLRELDGRDDRRARFRCVVACIPPSEATTGESGSDDADALRAEGTLEGAIASGPRGADGFGYDPVFVPEGEASTVAELGATWKRANSHRAGAARALLAQLDRW